MIFLRLSTSFVKFFLFLFGVLLYFFITEVDMAFKTKPYIPTEQVETQ